MMTALLQSEHGIRQLHRAVVDGRSHHPLLKIDVDGDPIKTGGGGQVELTDKELRETFPPCEAEFSRQSTMGSPSPRAEFAKLFRSVTRLSNEIHDVVHRMSELQDDGTWVVTRDGVPTGSATDVVDKLRKAADRILIWGGNYEASNPIEVEELEEVDLLADTEEVLA